MQFCYPLSEGYIESFTVVGEKPKQEIEVVLKYVQNNQLSVVLNVFPSQGRLYVSMEIPQTLAGYGLTILSTNKGVLTDSQARQQNVGGELIVKFGNVCQELVKKLLLFPQV